MAIPYHGRSDVLLGHQMNLDTDVSTVVETRQRLRATAGIPGRDEVGAIVHIRNTAPNPGHEPGIVEPFGCTAELSAPSSIRVPATAQCNPTNRQTVASPTTSKSRLARSASRSWLKEIRRERQTDSRPLQRDLTSEQITSLDDAAGHRIAQSGRRGRRDGTNPKR